MENYYEILSIEENATEREIKLAYAKMIKKFPPEKNEEILYSINSAYEVLTNSASRKEFDLKLPIIKGKIIFNKINRWIKEKKYNGINLELKNLLSGDNLVYEDRFINEYIINLFEIFIEEKQLDKSIELLELGFLYFNNSRNKELIFKYKRMIEQVKEIVKLNKDTNIKDELKKYVVEKYIEEILSYRLRGYNLKKCDGSLIKEYDYIRENYSLVYYGIELYEDKYYIFKNIIKYIEDSNNKYEKSKILLNIEE